MSRGALGEGPARPPLRPALVAGRSRAGRSWSVGQYICRLHIRPWLPPWPVRTGQRQSNAIRIWHPGAVPH